MVIRQNNTNIELMLGYVERLNEGRYRYEEKLLENIPTRQKNTVYRGLIRRGHSIVAGSYTTGQPIDNIQHAAKQLINDYYNYVNFSSESLAEGELEDYIKCTWILSFAYFFNAERSDVEKIMSHIPYTGKDKLIDRLIAAIIPEHPVSQDIAFPDVYKPICDAMGVYDKDARDVLVQLFLKKYYPSLKKHDVTWYDSHKEKDPEYNFHTGYWVFELAAIAVAIGWDDTDFRDNMYYPKDLADWKREQLNKENL
jgi:hypothetical protein